MINIKHIVLNSWKISYKKYITWVALIKVSNGELVCGFKFKYLSYFNLYILIFNWSSALIWFCCCCVLRFPPRPKKNMKYRNYRYYILFFLNVYCFHGKLYYDEKISKLTSSASTSASPTFGDCWLSYVWSSIRNF